jgi:hypothetical protein
MEWPEWWAWEVELSAHVELRMEQRDFTEIDLRRKRPMNPCFAVGTGAQFSW